MIVEPFGGPGGWAEGLRALGLASIGIEWDAAACATRAAAGHPTIRADVARYPAERFAGADAVIASPPCPMFSSAGKGAGRALMAELSAAIVDALNGRATIARHRKAMARRLQAAYRTHPGYRDEPRAERSAIAWQHATEAALTVQPARYITAIRPRWVALEQVPAVLPLWETYARELRRLGYSAWAGVVNAADFGVPQTRKRAVLLARCDGAVSAPPPTHCQGGASTLFGELHPWVSMADALGWPATWEAHGMRGRGVTERHGARPGTPATSPAPTVLTLAFGRDHASWQWQLHTNRDQRPDGSRQVLPVTAPAPALTAKAGGQWAFERPATTIAGDSRCWPPGHKVNADDRRRLGTDAADERYGDRAGTEAIRLTVAEALILQSFPPDYPVQGTKTKAFEQVGNAVPPLLAAHLVAAVTGRALEAAA